jgi:hypothetical protein
VSKAIIITYKNDRCVNRANPVFPWEDSYGITGRCNDT